MGNVVTNTEAPTPPPSREGEIPPTQATATVWDYVELARPTQWIKNVVVFAGPAAGLQFSSLTSLKQTSLAFAAFCLAASGTYAINDVMDREADASHPIKRNRPVARGVIRPAAALGLGLALAVAAFALSHFALNRGVTIVLLLYFALTLAYSITLKQRVLLDVIIVAIGFVLRAWAGSMAVNVVTSEWLVACVFTLCLFMGFGKRRCELAMIADLNQAGQHRSTLVRYTPQLLTHLITVSAAIAVITFLLYTLDSSDTATPFQKHQLFYTLPLVVYGVFRFAMHTELGIHSGPTEIVLKDRALLLTILTWTIIALAIAYQGELVGPGGFERLLGIR